MDAVVLKDESERTIYVDTALVSGSLPSPWKRKPRILERTCLIYPPGPAFQLHTEVGFLPPKTTPLEQTQSFKLVVRTLMRGHTSPLGVLILRMLAETIAAIAGRALHQVCDMGPVISVHLYGSGLEDHLGVGLHIEQSAGRIAFAAAHPPLQSTSPPFRGRYAHA